ncbi:MAG TPA: hypothetical protein VES64_06825 [Allosphingosinicella sp.]|nr:hypothetical protein [Allosphingosinicella sp.]
MLRGYWGIVLAAFGCLILAAAKAGPPPKAEINNQAADQRQQAPAPPPRAAPDSRESYRPHADYNQDDCYRNADHDAADLCAQWRAALAAEKAAEWSRRGVFVAIGGALLSFASVILVLMALGQGRVANRINMKEAGRNTRRAVAGAKATEAALTIATRNADAAAAQVLGQLRAWLAFEAVDEQLITDSVVNDEPVKNGLGFVISWKNSGGTPASNVRCYSRFAVALKTVAEIPPFSDKGVAYEAAGLIPHGLEYFTEPFILDDKNTHLFRTQKLRVILYSIIRYNDGYSSPPTPENERVSEVCLEAFHAGGTEKRKGVERETITYKQIGPQNRMS